LRIAAVNGDAEELPGQFTPRENIRKSFGAKRLTLTIFRVFSAHFIQRITSSATGGVHGG
jgi:hypothetical protein